MKKLIVGILIVSMMLAVAACGKNGGNSSGPENNNASSDITGTPEATATPGGTGKVAMATPAAGSWPLNGIETSYTPDGTLTNRRATIKAVFQQSPDAEKKEFDSESYKKAHTAEWETKATERIQELIDENLKNPDGGVIVTEKLEESILFGNGYRVDVYSHAVMDPNKWVWVTTTGSEEMVHETLYIVSAWLTYDGKTEFVELYRYCPVPAERRESWLGKYPIELYYDNTGKAAKDETLRNKVMTVLSEEFPIAEKTKRLNAWYFETDPDAEDNAIGKLKLMFAEISDKENGKKTTVKLGSYTNPTELYYTEDGDWQMFGHEKDAFAKEFYGGSTVRNTAVDDFSKNHSENVYTVRKECGKDCELEGVVTCNGDDLLVRVTLVNGENKLMVLDDKATTARKRYTDADGNSMVLTFGYPFFGDLVCKGLTERLDGLTDLTEATADWAIVKYFPKGATQPSQEFDTMSFLKENREQFAENAKTYEKQLKEQYGKIKAKQSVATAEKKLVDMELPGQIRFVIYENAAYGEVPKATGSGDVFLYEVAYYIAWNGAEDGESAVKGILFATGNASGKLSEKQHPMAMIWHYFTPTMKELATGSRIGREIDADVETFRDENGEEYTQYMYNSEEYWFEAYTDASGKLLLDAYDTWGESTDYYISLGTKLRTADGTVVYLEEGKTWNVLDRKMLDWAQPYRTGERETRLELAKADLGGATLSFRYSIYGKDCIYLNIYLVKDGGEVWIKDNRWISYFGDEEE